MINIGKYNLGRKEILNYHLVENISDLTLLSTRTQINVNLLTYRTNFTPTGIYIGSRPEITRKSYYIIGHINSYPIILARQEGKHPASGQTNLYSEYAKTQFHTVINQPLNQILKTLKI